MLMPRLHAGGLFIGALILGSSMASGQTYPNKPIRIVTAEIGGGNDFAARLIAQGISGPLGQRVIVDNRSGAAPEVVSRAQPDGYTLLLYSGTLWIRPLIRNMPFDPVKDFSPVTLAVSSPNVLVVHPSLPAKSVKALMALARLKPGELNYSTGGSGSANHLAGELFKAMAGVNIVRINYRGAGPALSALVAGEVQLMFASAGPVAPHVKSEKLRALAVTSAHPSALLADLPTVAASGLPGYEAASVQVIFVPTGTPVPIINRLNQEIVQVLNQTDVKEKFFSAAVEIVGSSPEQLAATMKSDMARMGKVIKDAGIRDE